MGLLSHRERRGYGGDGGDDWLRLFIFHFSVSLVYFLFHTLFLSHSHTLSLFLCYALSFDLLATHTLSHCRTSFCLTLFCPYSLCLAPSFSLCLALSLCLCLALSLSLSYSHTLSVSFSHFLCSRPAGERPTLKSKCAGFF